MTPISPFTRLSEKAPLVIANKAVYTRTEKHTNYSAKYNGNDINLSYIGTEYEIEDFFFKTNEDLIKRFEKKIIEGVSIEGVSEQKDNRKEIKKAKEDAYVIGFIFNEVFPYFLPEKERECMKERNPDLKFILLFNEVYGKENLDIGYSSKTETCIGNLLKNDSYILYPNGKAFALAPSDKNTSKIAAKIGRTHYKGGKKLTGKFEEEYKEHAKSSIRKKIQTELKNIDRDIFNDSIKADAVLSLAPNWKQGKVGICIKVIDEERKIFPYIEVEECYVYDDVSKKKGFFKLEKNAATFQVEYEDYCADKIKISSALYSMFDTVNPHGRSYNNELDLHGFCSDAKTSGNLCAADNIIQKLELGRRNLLSINPDDGGKYGFNTEESTKKEVKKSGLPVFNTQGMPISV